MASQGPNFPDSGASLSNAGTSENAEAWVNPGNITADDSSEAVITAATYDSPDISQILVASDFDFTIPTGATIDGIVVEIMRRNSAGAASDNRVQLATGTTFADLVGDNKADTALDWPTTEANKTYGSSSDTWNAGLTVSQINAVGFAVFLSVQADAANTDIQVDHIKVTVHYTPAAIDLTPTPVAAVTAVVAPVLALSNTLTPTPIAAVPVVTAPTVELSLGLAPAPVPAVTAVPAPQLVADQTLSPGPVPAVTATPAPALALELGLSPAPVPVVTAVPASVLSLALTLAPGSIPALTAIPAPVLSVGAVELTPAPVPAVTAVPTPTLSTVLALLPAPVAAVLAVGNSSLDSATTLSPGPVPVITAVPSPALAIALDLLPGPVLVTLTTPAPNVSTALGLSPGPVAAVLLVSSGTSAGVPPVVYVLPLTATMAEAMGNLGIITVVGEITATIEEL